MKWVVQYSYSCGCKFEVRGATEMTKDSIKWNQGTDYECAKHGKTYLASVTARGE